MFQCREAASNTLFVTSNILVGKHQAKLKASNFSAKQLTVRSLIVKLLQYVETNFH